MFRIINFFRVIIPAPIISGYHFTLSFLGAFWYGFPSRRMTVIGVTGTKGKTTTCNLIAHVLQSAGYMTGLTTTVNFKIGERAWINTTKQTMLGRFALQKLLREMVDAGCTHAVIETSSEGVLQHRHRFIDYRIAVFTNLSPEHIERHGSFEAYRNIKLSFFKYVARRSDSIGVYNLDNSSAEYFLKTNAATKIGYSQDAHAVSRIADHPEKVVLATNIVFGTTGTQYTVDDVPARTESVRSGGRYTLPFIGKGNLYNALAATGVAQALDIPSEEIRKALASAPQVPGRMEIVSQGKPFTVIVDYAHEPKSLEEAYTTAQLFHPKRMIGILGSQGGGRDVWKRSEMGKIAAQYLDVIILTNEDPYDEAPMHIIEDVATGVQAVVEEGKKELYKIPDRQEAIKKAISLAEPGDVVMLTGKGGEVWMCVERGRKIAWDESGIAKRILAEI